MEPTNTLLMGDEVISTIPARETDECIKSSVDDLVPIPKELEVIDSKPIISMLLFLTFSNPLFDFNDDYTLCYDNPLFDEEFEDISSLDPLELTLESIYGSPLNEGIGNSDSMSRSSETSDLFEDFIDEFGLDDSIPTKIDDRYYDSEGDILYFEQLLNEDTSSDVSQALFKTPQSLLTSSTLPILSRFA
ncbi:hypothetical protein Tco_0589064 [Tanacetum coccineum]